MANLDTCVTQFLLASNRPESDYYIAYQLGLRCFKDLFRNLVGEPCATELEILANNTALLPDNCAKVVRVGVVNNRGELIAFRDNVNLTVNDANCDGRLDQETTASVAGVDSFPTPTGANSYYSGLVGSYGLGSDVEYGDYKVLYNDGLIIFGFGVQPTSQVVLEYIPTADCEMELSEQIVETIIAYITWKFYSSRTNISLAEKREHERTYWNAKRLARNEIKAFDRSQIFIQYRRSERSAIKP